MESGSGRTAARRESQEERRARLGTCRHPKAFRHVRRWSRPTHKHSMGRHRCSPHRASRAECDLLVGGDGVCSCARHGHALMRIHQTGQSSRAQVRFQYARQWVCSGEPPADAGVMLILQQLRLLRTVAAPGFDVRKDGRVDLVQSLTQLSSHAGVGQCVRRRARGGAHAGEVPGKSSALQFNAPSPTEMNRAYHLRSTRRASS